MSRPGSAMVFAAGRGTRMRGLTRDRPKPLIAVAGRTLLDRALDLLVEAGVGHAVVNAHYRADQIAAHLRGEDRLAITLSPEPDLLETGGGLRQARPHLAGAAAWTVNADAVWQGPNPLLTPGLDPVPGGAALLLVEKAAAHGHLGPGDFFLDPDGTLSRRAAAPAAPYVYTGVQIIDLDRLDGPAGAVFSLNRIWDAMLAEGRLRGAVYAGQWCDVGQPESIAIAERMLAGG